MWNKQKKIINHIVGIGGSYTLVLLYNEKKLCLLQLSQNKSLEKVQERTVINSLPAQ